MQIILPDELKKWCSYDIKKFSWRLKKVVPKEVKEQFQKYIEKDLERYKI